MVCFSLLVNWFLFVVSIPAPGFPIGDLSMEGQFWVS